MTARGLVAGLMCAFVVTGVIAGASAQPTVRAASQAPLPGEFVVTDDTTMWRVRASGGPAGKVPLPLPKQTDNYVSDVDWSPDGRRIAFAYGEDPDHHDLWIADPDGRNPRRLAYGEPWVGGYSPDYPVWSPDGSRIAYSEFIDGEVSIVDVRTRRISLVPKVAARNLIAWSKSNRIWFQRWDRSGISTVRPNGTGKQAIPNSRGVYDLSPDENRLLGDDGKTSFVLNADGSQRTALAVPDSRAYLAIWGPDSRSIAFFKKDGLWVKKLSNGALHHISPLTVKGEASSFDWTGRKVR